MPSRRRAAAPASDGLNGRPEWIIMMVGRKPSERGFCLNLEKGIIFDLDGTLWDSSEQVAASWNVALKRHPELSVPVTGQTFRGLMGKTLPEIARILFPALSEPERLRILEELYREENAYLSLHKGVPYPRLRETLEELRRNYRLFVVSNCQEGYIEVFLSDLGLSPLFDDIECSGRTGRPKKDNIRLVAERNRLAACVYVGDTQGDCDSAKAAGVPFVHAAYGFGRVSECALSIGALSELPDRIGTVL